MTRIRSKSLATCLLAAVTGLVFLGMASPGHAEDAQVKVTVVVILATDQDKSVDKQLECIAKEVQKTEPSLTGFRLEKITRESLKIGEKEKFQLVDDEVATILVRHGPNEKNRVGLTVKAPHQGNVVYTTCCGKFFPILTRYQTTNNERLIIAVRVQPCKPEDADEKEKP